MESDALRKRVTVKTWLKATEGASPAEAIISIETVYARLTARVGAVIGTAGVDAIFARSVSSALPSLSTAKTRETPMRSCLSMHLRQLAAADAWQAAEVVFIGFIEVLITLIGDTLAWRLLSDISPSEIDRDAEAEDTSQ